MDIALARLIGIDIWKVPNSEQAHTELRKHPSGQTLDLYRPNEVLSAGYALWTITPQIPDVWNGRITATYLRLDSVEDYIVWTSLVEVHPNFIPFIVKMAGPVFSQQINELFDVIFPKLEGEQLQIDWMKYAFILYLEPDSPLTVESTESIRETADNARSLLGQTGYACKPNLLYDTLVFGGLGVTGPEREAVALGCHPLRFNSAKGSLVLPRIVWELSEYMGYGRIYGHLAARLTRLPFYVASLDQYIKQLNFDYLRFLEDRQISLSERLKVTDMADNLSRLSQDNYVSFALKNGLCLPIEEVQVLPQIRPYSYYFIDVLSRSLDTAQKEVRRVDSQIVSREVALADYLRDATTAQAIQSNLRLQAWTTWLAVGALLLSVVALVVGVLPESVKGRMWGRIERSVQKVFSSSR